MSFALNFANHLRIEKLQMATVFIIIQWKNADVALVFKKGVRDTVKNYGPISLL